MLINGEDFSPIGKSFHVTLKRELLRLCHVGAAAVDFAALKIAPELLDKEGGGRPGWEFLQEIKKEIWVEYRTEIEGRPRAWQGMLSNVFDFGIVLIRNDDAYYERTCGLVKWISDNHVLHHDEDYKKMKAWYWSVEKREERVEQIQRIWNRLDKEIAADPLVKEIVLFIMDYIKRHAKRKWPWNVRWFCGLNPADPACWYPVGRGQGWAAIHGGRG